jgi:predicted RecA/RadA family phage recombinase
MTAQAIDDNGKVIVNVMRPTFVKRFSNTTGTAGPFSYGTIVRVVSDAACYINFTTNAAGTADTITGIYIPANTPEDFKTGALDYIAVKTTTPPAAGTAQIVSYS